ncbi:TAXI family TRAP transporter solute-binding subunit [Pseudomonas benzenivorans]|uniref:TAXI family TRAP transporter solute-binding subunit n=1 Tax=Pseudomonas benzenivorans TaxID=556533 RepID=A0ABY5HAH6_9PSED|nr:TAXI family TRAP transporter solute-binding subunit [Pseudomonas benzenivorans]UTW09343.1 TAXI family TRAP transporter solute-binding subunit [Pseudomonas benzenivorans]
MNTLKTTLKNTFKRTWLPALAAGALAFSGSAYSQTSYNLGAVPTGTGWFFGISEGARVINANTPYEITIRETGGTSENATRLTTGDIQLGFIEALVGQELYNGSGRFEKRANPDARLIYWIAPSTMHWAVAQDSGVKTLKDLEGKRFNPSSIGGGGEYITDLVFKSLGIKPDFQRMRIDDAAEGVVDGRLVGFSYNGVPPIPAFTEVHSSRPLQLLSLDQEQVAKVVKDLPFLSPAVIPADTYRGMSEATTMGIYMGIGTTKKVPEEVIYNMTKAYWENHDAVANAFAPAKGVTPQDTVNNATLPLHAGAIRYYREIGLDIPASVIPPEAL